MQITTMGEQDCQNLPLVIKLLKTGYDNSGLDKLLRPIISLTQISISFAENILQNDCPETPFGISLASLLRRSKPN